MSELVMLRVMMVIVVFGRGVLLTGVLGTVKRVVVTGRFMGDSASTQGDLWVALQIFFLA